MRDIKAELARVRAQIQEDQRTGAKRDAETEKAWKRTKRAHPLPMKVGADFHQYGEE